MHLYAAQHFVHTPCTLMPQRGLCTVLVEEEHAIVADLWAMGNNSCKYRLANSLHDYFLWLCNLSSKRSNAACNVRVVSLRPLFHVILIKLWSKGNNLYEP